MGWAIGPLPVVKAMGNVQSQETSAPSSISQIAALTALDGDQKCVEDMRKEFEARRDLVCARLRALPGIRCPIPDGAFYAFFNISSFFGKTLKGKKITDSASFCAAALETVHVNLVQGSAFGAEGYARLSFACSRDQINKGIDRLAEFLQS
jgi:aspartate aminotransferase